MCKEEEVKSGGCCGGGCGCGDDCECKEEEVKKMVEDEEIILEE